jgi:hypothetical protein
VAQCQERSEFGKKKIEIVASYGKRKVFEFERRLGCGEIWFSEGVEEKWEMRPGFDFLERTVGIVLTGKVPGNE